MRNKRMWVMQLRVSGPADGQFCRVGSGHLLNMRGVKGHLRILCRCLDVHFKEKATVIPISQPERFVTCMTGIVFMFCPACCVCETEFYTSSKKKQIALRTAKRFQNLSSLPWFKLF
jgi:hypothetical protein